jgi:hypothetical protein
MSIGEIGSIGFMSENLFCSSEASSLGAGAFGGRLPEEASSLGAGALDSLRATQGRWGLGRCGTLVPGWGAGWRLLVEAAGGRVFMRNAPCDLVSPERQSLGIAAGRAPMCIR